MASVYEWGTHYLVGDLVRSESTHPMVEAMAVRQADGSRSLLLINKAAGPATLILGTDSLPGKAASPVSTRLLDSHGATEPAAATLAEFTRAPITLAPYSLLLIRVPSPAARKVGGG